MSTDLAHQPEQMAPSTVTTPEAQATALAHILGTGDLSQLSNDQRVGHYLDVCLSLGLNPRTRPFDWIEFYDPQTRNKKLQLYPNRSCAEQLRRQHQISVRVVRREPIGNGDDAMFVVEVEGTTPNGRVGTAIKYVPLTGTRQNGERYRLSGQALANAYMKAETGALRRLTFSMVGMASPPDSDELHRVRFVVVDGTGRVLDDPTDTDRALAERPDMARAIREPTFETSGEAAAGPFAGHASQAVRPDELERPKRQGAPATFKADVDRWLGAWFAAVKDTRWDTDDARRRFVAEYTKSLPEPLQTSSLRHFFSRCSDSQAGDLLARIRGLVAAQKGDRGGRSYQELFGDESASEPAVEQPKAAPSSSTPEVHAAAVLTGAPPLGPDRPDWSRTYKRPELLELYEQWSARMRQLDAHWTADDVKRLPDKALRAAVDGVIAQVDDLEQFLARTDDEADETTVEAF